MAAVVVLASTAAAKVQRLKPAFCIRLYLMFPNCITLCYFLNGALF